jgi:hypothetical protein
LKQVCNFPEEILCLKKYEAYIYVLVCNPKFIVLWNGGERLVLAFVLLSMKSNSFFHWSCFLSLAILIATSVVLGTSILVQWAILVMALSSLSSAFTLNPLAGTGRTPVIKQSPPTYSKLNEEPMCTPTYEANLLPPATTVGFYSPTRSISGTPRKPRSKRKR